MCKDGFKAQIIWVVKQRGVQVQTVVGGTSADEVKAKVVPLLGANPDEVEVIDSGARKERCGGCGQKA